jgi:hypothetical protein
MKFLIPLIPSIISAVKKMAESNAETKPLIGWFTAAAVLYTFIIRDLLVWVADVNAWPHPPIPDVEMMVYVLLSLLGVEGGARTIGAMRQRKQLANETQEKAPEFNENYPGP